MSPMDLAALVSALVFSTSLLMLVVAAVWWFDRYDREPLHLVVGVFLWGILAAPVISAAISSFVGLALGSPLSFLLVGLGPVVEEVMKAFGVGLVVFLSREFDNPTDGVVYGTAVGLGFAASENILYAVVGAGTSGVGGTLGLILARTALSSGIHALSSATFGGCVGFASLSRRPAERYGWVVGGLLGAILLHSGWNLALLRATPTVDRLPHLWLVVLFLLYGLYVAVLAAFLRSEQRILFEQLGEEVRLAVVPPWVGEVIPYYRRRVRSDWWPSRSERTVLARLLTRLAFRKHAVRRLPGAEANIANLEVMRLRQRVRAMLGLGGECQTSVESDDSVP